MSVTVATVTIDVPSLTKEQKQGILTGLASHAISFLEKAAMHGLRSRMTYDIYKRALHAEGSVVMGDDEVVITLKRPAVGFDPNCLEQGGSAFDMKQGLLAGRKVKGKTVKYVDVPFRHSTPGSKGTFTPMARKDYDVIKAAIGEKEKKITEVLTKSGATSTAAAAKLANTTLRGPHTTPTGPKSGHKVGLYADMLSIKKQYEQKSDTQYMTIRRVSMNSDSSSWMHPGWTALNLFPKAAADVEKFGASIVQSVSKGR